METNEEQDDLPEEIVTKVDDRYCTPLLSPEQRAALVAAVNGPDELTEDDEGGND